MVMGRSPKKRLALSTMLRRPDVYVAPGPSVIDGIVHVRYALDLMVTAKSTLMLYWEMMSWHWRSVRPRKLLPA